jgi:hypothetical protein
MASVESSVENQISIPDGCSSLSHLNSHCAKDISQPQIAGTTCTTNTTDKTAPSLWSIQASRRRLSLVAYDVLPIGLLDNASVAGQLLENTFDSCKPNRRPVSCAAAIQNPMAVEKVQRWSGMTRTVSDWDGLRRVSTATRVVYERH